MNFEFNILIIGSNVSLAQFIKRKVQSFSDNHVDVSHSLRDAFEGGYEPYLIFLAAEQATSRTRISAHGLKAVIKNFPGANVIVYGEESIPRNLTYVSLGARDFISSTMLALPHIEPYLRKRMYSDWTMVPVFAN